MRSQYFGKLTNLHKVYVPYYNNLEVVIDLLNPGPHIGVIYMFLLNPKMRFCFQVNILEFSLHTIKQEIQGIKDVIDAPS
jgi:hypothetical protein